MFQEWLPRIDFKFEGFEQNVSTNGHSSTLGNRWGKIVLNFLCYIINFITVFGRRIKSEEFYIIRPGWFSDGNNKSWRTLTTDQMRSQVRLTIYIHNFKNLQGLTDIFFSKTQLQVRLSKIYLLLSDHSSSLTMSSVQITNKLPKTMETGSIINTRASPNYCHMLI